MSYEFLPIKTDIKSITEITKLLQITFPHAKKYTEGFVKWQYIDNPIGEMIGYNAYFEGELAAHYALMPVKSRVFGNEELGLLSLNTATHPDHRGKKLFTELATKSFQAATEMGFGFVIGVANAQSTPGFIRKLNFQLIGMLNAKLGWGNISRQHIDTEVDYQRIWDDQSIQWRLSNPELAYKRSDSRITAPTDHYGIQAILKDFDEVYQIEDNHIGLGFRPVKLWIGIDDTINWKKSFYFDIPTKLRPSPLNLIFKDLTARDRTFDFAGVKFDALDFDAY